MEVVIFGDVEGALVTHIETRLALYGRAVPVSVLIPNPRPEEFAIVPRIGGLKRDLVTETVDIAVECWAATEAAALSLAQLVRGVIHALPGDTISGLTVYRVQEAAGPALLPDPDSAQARYVLTVSLDVRASLAYPEGIGTPATL